MTVTATELAIQSGQPWLILLGTGKIGCGLRGGSQRSCG